MNKTPTPETRRPTPDARRPLPSTSGRGSMQHAHSIGTAAALAAGAGRATPSSVPPYYASLG